ncbi:hypothetical protein PG984_016529 [Apiospora sp. TS-2023a]
MRPQTPNINMEMRRPTSPPETPPTGSPAFSRSKGPNGRASPGAGPLGGVGKQFDVAPGVLHPEAISPMESTEGDEESDSDDSDASDASDSPPQSPASYVHRDETWSSIQEHLTTTTIEIEEVEIEETFTIVEQDEDDMDSDDDEDNPPLQPDSIEYPESSRSGSPSSQEVPEDVLNGMANVSCGDESDTTDSEFADDDLIQQLRLMRQARRQRRMTSVSKRTVSERGSDSDREDLQPYDMGESTNQRRIRRKLNRLSLISNPQDIIIELAEPTSDDQMSGDDGEGESGLFHFWRLMEVDDADE